MAITQPIGGARCTTLFLTAVKSISFLRKASTLALPFSLTALPITRTIPRAVPTTACATTGPTLQETAKKEATSMLLTPATKQPVCTNTMHRPSCKTKKAKTQPAPITTSTPARIPRPVITATAITPRTSPSRMLKSHRIRDLYTAHTHHFEKIKCEKSYTSYTIPKWRLYHFSFMVQPSNHEETLSFSPSSVPRAGSFPIRRIPSVFGVHGMWPMANASKSCT